jgi:hypothetical protein
LFICFFPNKKHHLINLKVMEKNIFKKNPYVESEVLTPMVMKGSIFWDTTPCSLLKDKQCFGGTCPLHLQGQRISQARNQCEAGSKQSKWPAKISGYVGNRWGLQASKSVPLGSPVGQNESPVPIGSPTQPCKPIRERNMINSIALKWASSAGLGKDRGEVIRV